MWNAPLPKVPRTCKTSSCEDGLFILLTLTHTAAHGCVGWILDLGLKAQCRGDFARAVRFLALAEQPGMDHYDPRGVALAALKDCRRRLAFPSDIVH